jgi:hypothetical protein
MVYTVGADGTESLVNRRREGGFPACEQHHVRGVSARRHRHLNPRVRELLAGSRAGSRPWGIDMPFVEVVHRALEYLPALARFAIFMALTLITPRISRVLRLPVVVGLLSSGVVLGPRMPEVFAKVSSALRTNSHRAARRSQPRQACQ